MERLWSRAVATSRNLWQKGRPRKRLAEAKILAAGCDRLPPGPYGKEGVEGYLFLGVVMDMCSRKIVGWSMRDDLKAELVVDALAMAVTRRRPAAGLVHHSDRGSQYTSLAFGRTLRESGLVASIGSRGDAYDNAACESVISTLKVEWIKRHRYESRDQARLSIFRYIETFYNPRRRHSSLGGISPNEYERRCQTDYEQGRLIQ